MIFKYPYTDMYALNLDWLIQAVKEVQEIVEPLDRVVNSVNGLTGDVEITKALLTQILGNLVETFNGRTGDIELTAEDVNQTMIDITWTSDPGDTIGDLSQSELDEMYLSGKRVLIFVNNLSVADQIYFLQYYEGHAQPQLYSPTAALAGVSSFNGRTGAIIATGSNLPTSNNDTTPIAETLTAQSDSIGTLSQLNTTDKTSLVNAVNEVNENVNTLGPYNGTDSDSTTAALAAAQGKALAEDIDNLQAAAAYVEDGDNATQKTYVEGEFIVWKGLLYTVNSGGIPSGTAITGHVTAVPGGGLNAVKSDIANLNSVLTGEILSNPAVILTDATLDNFQVIKCANILFFRGNIDFPNTQTSAYTNVLDFGMTCYSMGISALDATDNSVTFCGVLNTNGRLSFTKYIPATHRIYIYGSAILR